MKFMIFLIEISIFFNKIFLIFLIEILIFFNEIFDFHQ